MPATYEPISTTTLGSAASSITFSSIPGTYTDLRLVLVGANSASGANWYIRYNGTTGSSDLYSYTLLKGNGSAASSASSSADNKIVFNETSTTSTTIPMLTTIDVFSYAGSTNKTCLIEWSGDENGSGTTQRIVGLYRSTSAITSIALVNSGANFATGTVATVYGILKA